MGWPREEDFSVIVDHLSRFIPLGRVHAGLTLGVASPTIDMVRCFLNHATEFSVGVVARAPNCEGFSTRALDGWLANVANAVVVEIQLVRIVVRRAVVNHGEDLVVIGIAVRTAPFVNIAV